MNDRKRRRIQRQIEREKKKQKRISICAMCVILLICAILLGQTLRIRSSNSKKRETYESLQVEATKESKKGDALEESKEYAKSDDYIESMARERLNLAKKDEIIVKPKEN